MSRNASLPGQLSASHWQQDALGNWILVDSALTRLLLPLFDGGNNNRVKLKFRSQFYDVFCEMRIVKKQSWPDRRPLIDGRAIRR